LIDLEIAQALRRYALSGVISPDRGSEAITDLANFPLTRYPHLVLLPRVWQMRQNLTAYDSAYLALSEALRATLVTRDRALGQFRTPVHVEVV